MRRTPRIISKSFKERLHLLGCVSFSTSTKFIYRARFFRRVILFPHPIGHAKNVPPKPNSSPVKKLQIWSHLLKKSLMENFIFLCSGTCWNIVWMCEIRCISKNDFIIKIHFSNLHVTIYPQIIIIKFANLVTSGTLLITKETHLCEQSSQGNTKHTADLVTFTEKILNGKLHFLCSVSYLRVIRKRMTSKSSFQRFLRL